MPSEPLLSIIVTSYTMERFRDICDLFDTIKNENQRMCQRERGEIASKSSLPFFSQDSEEYGRGMEAMEAKEYVERRLAENGNRMIIETRKMGKWRRWLAKVYLSDAGKTLNEELVEKGLARRLEEHAGGG